jgi:hypothetical protein
MSLLYGKEVEMREENAELYEYWDDKDEKMEVYVIGIVFILTAVVKLGEYMQQIRICKKS